jgi:hypothetical protein
MAVMCVYCGNRLGNTRDHVPPQNLFPKPKLVNMVTVPSCEECQASFKKDEDVFMAWITFGPAGESPAGKLLWEQKLKRTYEKDGGIKKVIARSFKQVNLETPAGIYAGKKLVISIDPERKNKVLRKIARGLFWVEYKERLPENIPIEIYGIHGKDEILYELIGLTNEATTAWEGIFEYRHVREPKHFESYWIMSFFRRNYFVAIVNDTESTKEMKEVHNE